VSRFVDRGAVVAAYVGIGMAVTMAISFLLVIPIEPAYVLLSVPGGLIIGYYANARSARARGQWRRILPNALAAGLATGLTLAALALATKALFFFGDSGYPDFNRLDPDTGAILEPTCISGGDCTYHRYLLKEPAKLAEAGVTDATSFGDVYWSQQWSTARLLVGLTTSSALIGGVLFGIAGPRRQGLAPRGAAVPA
jgi:hypothetical protein